MNAKLQSPSHGRECANPSTYFLKSEKYVLLEDYRLGQSYIFKSYQKDEIYNLSGFNDETSIYSIVFHYSLPTISVSVLVKLSYYSKQLNKIKYM